MTKLKIKNKCTAASPGLFRTEDNSIELLDAPLLKKANSNFGDFFPEEQSLRKVMAPDTLFFYTIEHIKIKDGSKMIFAEEKGIGKIKIKRKRYFLERETFHYQMGFRDLTSQDGLLYFDDETYLVVGTYAPSSHNEVYAIPHSVAYTGDEPFSPHILQLDNECVLGRLDDEIQSIDKNELKQILGYEDPLETLLTYNGPLILNTKFLELIGKKSMILSDQVALKPQKIRPREKQAGSIIFNEKKNRFEGFDGTKWRPLQWGDE